MLARFSVRMNETLNNPTYLEVPPEQVRGVPAKRISELSLAVEGLGFQKLYSYTGKEVGEIGIRNYIVVFFHPDANLYAEVYYLRSPWFLRLLLFVFDRSNFHTTLLNVSYTSAWQDDSALRTAADGIVLSAQHESDVIIKEKVEPAVLFELHRKKLAELQTERPSLRNFRTREDYEEFVRVRNALAYNKGPKSVEDLFAPNQQEGSPNSH